MCVFFYRRIYMDIDDNCNNKNSVKEDGGEESSEQETTPKPAKKPKKKKKKVPSWVKWGFFVLILSFILSFLFSLLTEVSINDDSPIYVCIIVLVVLLCLNIFCDMLANAVLSCNAEGFNAMASNKIRGAKRAVKFCKNSTKIASVFADVIGDICGIVSGAVGTTFAAYFAFVENDIALMFISIIISALIGALTVGGKAFCKTLAIKYNKQITFAFAKFTTYFKKEK